MNNEREIIRVLLLFAVAVASVGAYLILFNAFQRATQHGNIKDIYYGGINIISMTDDGSSYYIVLQNNSTYELKIQIRYIDYNNKPYVFRLDLEDNILEPYSTKTFKCRPDFNISRGTQRTFCAYSDPNDFFIYWEYTDS